MPNLIKQKRRVTRHNEKRKRKSMRPFNMSDEEKEKLLKQHKEATKEANEKRIAQKNGMPVPEEKKK